MAWQILRDELYYETNWFLHISEEIEPIYDEDLSHLGIKFYLYGLIKRTDKAEYRVVGKEIVSRIRRFIRNRLSDYKSLKKGFEEQQ